MHSRKLVGHLVILGTIFTGSVASAQTQVSVSARVGDFHVAVANYYHVPEREVVVLHESRVSDNDLPVVLFIAREARVPAARVMALRQAGRSWWDISVHFGVRPDVYYVPVAVAPGPPYGHAYGHYKKPRSQWNTIVLSDADVLNLVHVRFLSEHYGIPPERVIELRGQRRDVVAVSDDVRVRSKGKSQGDQPGKGHDASSKGNGNASKGNASSSKGNGNEKENGKGRGKH